MRRATDYWLTARGDANVPTYVLPEDVPWEKVFEALQTRFRLAPQEEVLERVSFLDTFDWKAWRERLVIRVFSQGRRHVLSLSSAKGPSLITQIQRIPGFASELPLGPMRDRLEGVSKIRRFLPQARMKTTNQWWAILNADEKTVARLLIREGTALHSKGNEGHRLPPLLHVVPLKGFEKEAKEVRTFLRKVLWLNPSRKGELGIALKVLGRSPGDYTSKFRLNLPSATMPAADAARAIHRRLLTSIRMNEAGVIKDLDSEFLHDLRVGVRRTRSALTQIKGVFPAAAVEHFKSEFRWLGRRTGPARDLDVYLLQIPRYRAALPEMVGDHLEPLVRFLEKKKATQHKKLVRTLRSKKYARLMEAWTAFLDNPPPDPTDAPNALRPAKDLASERIRKAFNRVVKQGKEITHDSPAAALHGLRIECKKLRYLITFFYSLFPPEALDPLVKELKMLQDNLGNLNDLHLQREALRESAEAMLAEELAPPETLMAMGRLMGQMETREAQEREAFHERFRRFSRPKNRKRFARLFGEDEVDEVAPAATDALGVRP